MNRARRHQNDTKNFEELTFAEQTKAINIRVAWFPVAVRAHIRKRGWQYSAERIRGKVAAQLRRIADQIEMEDEHAEPAA